MQYGKQTSLSMTLPPQDGAYTSIPKCIHGESFRDQPLRQYTVIAKMGTARDLIRIGDDGLRYRRGVSIQSLDYSISGWL